MMLMLLHFNLLGIVSTLHMVHGQLPRYCPVPIHSTRMEFSKTPANLAFGCNGQYTELHCCMNGYDSLQWYQKQEKPGSPWQEFSYDNTRKRYMKEGSQNQTAVFQKTNKTLDEGVYKCVGRKAGSEDIVNQVTFQVDMCTSWTKPVIATLPIKQETTFRRLHGQNLTVICHGFYGLETEYPMWSILWQQWKKKKPRLIRRDCNASHVCAVEGNADPKTSKELILQITGIEAEDYGKYQCRMNNGYQDEKGNTNTVRTIYLKYGEVHTSTYQAASITIGIIGVIAVVTCAILFAFRLDIHLQWKLRYSKQAPVEGKHYDIFLIYSHSDENDSQFVLQTVCPELKNLGYKVFVGERDFEPGRSLIEIYIDTVRASQALLFILSPGYLKHPWGKFTLEEALNGQYCQNILFIKYRPISKELWEQVHQISKAMSEMNSKLKWPQTDSQWQVRQFWKKVQIQLPRPLPLDDDIDIVVEQNVDEGQNHYRPKVASVSSMGPLLQEFQNNVDQENTEYGDRRANVDHDQQHLLLERPETTRAMSQDSGYGQSIQISTNSSTVPV